MFLEADLRIVRVTIVLACLRDSIINQIQKFLGKNKLGWESPKLVLNDLTACPQTNG